MQPLYEYVCHIKGHRNSKGELAEWVIKSHETGKILSSHKSEKKAKEHLQQMHIFKESVDSMSDKLLGETTNGNTMDKRIEIFMESVGQLGLSTNQVDSIGKITKACVEGVGSVTENGGDEPCYVSAKIVNPMMIDDIDHMVVEGNLDVAIEKYKELVGLSDGACYTNFVPTFTDDSGNDSGFVIGTHDGVTLAHNDTDLGTYNGVYLIYRKLSPEEKKFVDEHFEDTPEF